MVFLLLLLLLMLLRLFLGRDTAALETLSAELEGIIFGIIAKCC